MPELLEDGLPERTTHSKFDFSRWADGQAWKFVKDEDYNSTTETFRYNVRRWAKANGYEAECRPLPMLDSNGQPLPATKADPIGLAVCFRRAGSARPSANSS